MKDEGWAEDSDSGQGGSGNGTLTTVRSRSVLKVVCLLLGICLKILENTFGHLPPY